MKNSLYDKILENLTNMQPVRVEYYHWCNTMLPKLDNQLFSSDFTFFKSEFENWYDEELGSIAVSDFDDIYTDTYQVEFVLVNSSLFANITFESVYPNRFLGNDENYDKTIILTDTVRSIIISYLDIFENDFDDDLLEGQIVYENGFHLFKLFYDSAELFFRTDDLINIKGEVEKVILDLDHYTGVYTVISPKKAVLTAVANFEIYETVEYSLLIERDA